MGICLNMIVKDEAANLERLFASLHKTIDYFVISDTGSSDNTIEKIYELGLKYNIPGIVYQHLWVDFAHNRNLAWQAALKEGAEGKHSCKWLMIIDADEELIELDSNWKESLDEGFSYTTYKKLENTVFKHFFLLWIEGQKFQWEGRIHNYLICLNGKILRAHLNQVFIQSYIFVGAKSKPFKDYREKALNDVSLLLEELNGKELQLETLNRFFQLGFLFQILDDSDSALFYLEKIAEFEEASKDIRYTSLILIIKNFIKDRVDSNKIQIFINRAIKIDSDRADAYYYHAILYRRLGDFSNAFLELKNAEGKVIGEKSFFYFEEDIYTWKIKYELAFVCFQLKEYRMAEKFIFSLIENSLAPKEEEKFLSALLDRINNVS
jgi:hypothetical protein